MTYEDLFRNPDVRRWYDNLARGSRITADVYLRRLGNFCKEHSTTPQRLASRTSIQLENLLLDSVSKYEEKNYAGSYIHSTLKALKSWLGHNRRELKLRIKIKGAQETPSLSEERVPTKEELKRIFLASDSKGRAASVLIAHCGLRPETLGNYLGNDGLRLRDLPELRLEGKQVEFIRVPTMIVVRPSLNKARHQYFTFASEEACEYLKEYLEERMRKGETLIGDSALVTAKRPVKPFVRTTNIGDMIRLSLRRAGLPWRPYVLRSYFDTQMMLAESKGLVLRDYRQFWMGHKGDIESRYTTNKNRLPEKVMEDMREALKRSQNYLQTMRAENGETEIKQAFQRQLLAVAGFTEEEIGKYDLNSVSDEQLHSLVQKRLLGLMEENGSRQRVVRLEEVEKLISEGWEYVATLPNGHAILKMPF